MRRKHGIEDKRTSENRSKKVPPCQGFHNAKTQFHSQYYNDPSEQNSSYQIHSPHHDPNELIRGMVDLTKPIVELKKNLDFIFGSMKPNISLLPSPWLPGPTGQFAAPYLPPDLRIPFGFRARFCGGCLKNVLVVVRYDREVDGHTCDAGINKSLAIKDKFEIVKKLSDNSGDLLFDTASRFQFYLLHAAALKGDGLETLEIVTPNPLNPERKISIFSEKEKKINIDLDHFLTEKNGSFIWLKTLVQEGWAILGKSDLRSYLRLVKTASFAFFRIKYMEETRSYFISLRGR